MCLILLSGTFFLVFMRVCGLFSVSKKDWCPITVIPVLRDICKGKRSFRLIFSGWEFRFFAFTTLFSRCRNCKSCWQLYRWIDKSPKRDDFKPSRYKGVVRPFLEPLRLTGRGGFPLPPSPRPSPPKLLTWLGKNKITLSSNSARTSSFQQPTRKDE